MDNRAILKATIGNFFKIPGTEKLLWPVAKRFVAGKTMDAAITKALELRKKGYLVTFAYLGGEHLQRETDMAKAVLEHRQLLSKIQDSALCGCNIAIKLSQFGFFLEEPSRIENIIREEFKSFFEKAEKSGTRIWLDAEELRCRAKTFIFRNGLKHNRQNNGLAIQVYAKDYPEIILSLSLYNITDFPIRVCKGAYRETPETIERNEEILRGRMINAVENLIRNSKSPMIQIATHDEKIISMAKYMDRVEYGLLYGRHKTPLIQELLKKGRRVNVYMPYGPKWKDFCVRRVIEKPGYFKLLLPWKK